MVASSGNVVTPWHRSPLGYGVAAVLAAILVAIDQPWQGYWSRGLLRDIAVVATYAGLLLGVLLACLSRNRWVRWTACLILSATLIWHVGYYRVTHERFSFNGAMLVLNNIETASQATATYWLVFLPLLVIVPAVFGAFELVARRLIAFRARWSLLVVPMVACMGFIMWHTAGRIEAFPTPFRVPGLLIYCMTVGSHGPPDAPYIPATGRPMVSHIVLVIDESVKATHLSVNGYERPTTPFLVTRMDRLCTLGIASAAGNSSYTSQAVLFNGGTLANLVDGTVVLFRKPSIAAYAVSAKFRFGFFDGQSYQRLIASARHALPVEDFLYVSAGKEAMQPREMWDAWLADRIAGWVADNECTVTYVAKQGAHFPYEMTYPQDRKPFAPTVNGYAWSDDEAANRNSYDNAVTWACDGFLGALLTALERLGTDVVVVYTSDHGQALPGTVPGSRQTHCNPSLPPDSAEVPLLLWGSGRGQDVVRRIQANTSLVDNASHFEIFPTLLTLMGYDKDEVLRLYGPGLFDQLPAGRKRFYLGGVVEVRLRSKQVEFNPRQLRDRSLCGR